MKRHILFFFVYSISAAFILSSCNDDNPVESETEHFEAIGLYVISSGDTIVSYVGGVVDGQIGVVAGDETALLSIKFIEEDGDVGIPPGNEWSLDWSVADTAVAEVEVHADELELYRFHIVGKKPGKTNITIIINHNEHKDFESLPITIDVLAPGKVSGNGFRSRDSGELFADQMAGHLITKL